MVSFPKGKRAADAALHYAQGEPGGGLAIESPSFSEQRSHHHPPWTALSPASFRADSCVLRSLFQSRVAAQQVSSVSANRGEAGTGMNPRWARPRLPSWDALQTRQKDSVNQTSTSAASSELPLATGYLPTQHQRPCACPAIPVRTSKLNPFTFPSCKPETLPGKPGYTHLWRPLWQNSHDAPFCKKCFGKMVKKKLYRNIDS